MTVGDDSFNNLQLEKRVFDTILVWYFYIMDLLYMPLSRHVQTVPKATVLNNFVAIGDCGMWSKGLIIPMQVSRRQVNVVPDIGLSDFYNWRNHGGTYDVITKYWESRSCVGRLEKYWNLNTGYIFICL